MCTCLLILSNVIWINVIINRKVNKIHSKKANKKNKKENIWIIKEKQTETGLECIVSNSCSALTPTLSPF